MDPRIVVVDDEPDVLELVCEVLEEDGFDVIPVEHPERIHKYAGVRPALMLIDIMLPGRSGIQLAESLRSDGYGDVPMVAMSASRGMLDAAERSGLFQATLPKPFDLDELLDCVDLFMQQRRSA